MAVSRHVVFQTQSTISFILTLCLTLCSVSASQSRMILSSMCNPQCSFGTTCVEQPSVCSFLNCPTYLSCIPTSRLPSQLVEALQAMSSNPTTSSTSRPGCPASGLHRGPCITQCQQDIDCGQGQICCPNSCGRLCKPDLREMQVPRPGSCPHRVSIPFTFCESECQSDHDCPGVQKCCHTSCGAKACATPCFLQLTGRRWRQPRRCRRRQSVRSGSQGRRNKRKFRSRRRRDRSMFSDILSRRQ